MYLESVHIKNYKSIRYAEFEFQKSGKGTKSSFTSILLGINESGKSNLLDAIKSIGTGIELNYKDICHKSVQKDEEDVTITGQFKIEDQNRIIEILQSSGLPDFIFEDFRFEHIEKTVYLNYNNGGSTSFNYTVKCKKERFQVNPQNQISEIDGEISKGYVKLDEKKFISIIKPYLSSHLNKVLPQITYWTPDSQYLINGPISINNFIQNPNTSIPFQNILHIYGLDSTEKMKRHLQRISGANEEMAEFLDSLSEKITAHLRKIWKRHPVSIKFNRGAGDQISIVVVDNKNKYEYFRFEQRSEGFKNFVSLILSLSAQNAGDQLKNNVILIDEPENHLHPGGVEMMRDELLKIGKKNQVLISTHSTFMVDTNSIERHWIMSKVGESKLERVDSTKSLYDERVMARAFGIQFLRELIPDCVILVEGKCDKIVLEVGLTHLMPELKYSIKVAGGSKVYSVASVLAGESIHPFVFLDSDHEGRKTKNEILKSLKDHYNSKTVNLISDLKKGFINSGTIEDLYPREFVKVLLKDSYPELDLDKFEDQTVLNCIRNQDASFKNREKMDNLKTKMSEEFKEVYSADSVRFEKECIAIVEVIKKIVEKIK